MSLNHKLHWSFDDLADEVAFAEAQQSERDLNERIEARDRAIDRVETHADPLWFEDALDAVEHCARAEREFTSEDVAALIGRQTHEPRALGAVLRVAKDRGWCVPTDRFVPATHPSRHMAPIRVWASNLFVREAA